jgi:hypothetical protein
MNRSQSTVKGIVLLKAKVLPFNIQQDVFGVVFQQESDGISWVPSSAV